MNIDWTVQMPATLDIAHISLAALAFVLLIAALIRPKAKPADRPSDSDQVADQSQNVSDNNVSDNKAEEAQMEKPQEEKVKVEIKEKIVKEVSVIKESTPDTALQLLSLLQKEARLIDFVQEDLTGFSDADVGAAARVVHEGSKKIIEKHFTLTAIRNEEEESALTVESGFDPQEIRLTGNVTGQAPYKGILVHKGWQVTDVKLPQLVDGHKTTILAPAEVEL